MTGADHHFKPLKFIHPKYLLTWVALGLAWLCSKLPYAAILKLGTLLGWLTYTLSPGRRRIARTNIRLCFPELNEQQQRQLVKQNFYDSSITILESPLSWWGSDDKLKKLHRVEGLEYLLEARAKGKGVIMLGGHYTTLEISGRFLAYHIDFLPTFKRAHNKLFNAIMARCRSKLFGGLLHSSDMRSILRYLQNNGIIWFAADQDFGRRGSVFAPFMGVATSCLTMTSRLAKKSGAVVIPMYSERLPGKQGYLIRFSKPLSEIPSGDDVLDATLINRAIEEQIRRTPSQYLWGHRRFKTRPYGEPLVYAPKKDPALKRYGLLMPLLSLPMVFFTLWMALKNRDRAYLLQRLGLQLPKQSPGGIWLHAASVGEVNAVMPLIKALQEKHPHLPITLTTATPTGGQTARDKLPEGCVQHFLPLDWLWLVKRFCNKLQPQCLLVVETEMWPKLFWHCYRSNIPIIMLNGRLSERTQPKSPWLARLYCSMAQQLRYVFARNETDKERFTGFGVPPECIRVMGNIKLATAGQSPTVAIDLGRPYVLVASTRDDEEWRIVEAWLKTNHQDTLLVIVPRHPNRLEAIRKQLAAQVTDIAVRSKNEPVLDTTRVYLADTFGELRGFIAGSRFVIMGGSFVPLGGQNIIEVGQQGKAVIFGPHMGNFADEASLFLEREAGIQVQDTDELAEQIECLLNNPDQCRQLGENGRQLLQEFSHIIEDYVTELEQLCPKTLHQQ